MKILTVIRGKKRTKILILPYKFDLNWVAGDQAIISKGNHLEQREKLGLNRAPNPRASRAPHPEPTNSLQKVEVCNL